MRSKTKESVIKDLLAMMDDLANHFVDREAEIKTLTDTVDMINELDQAKKDYIHAIANEEDTIISVRKESYSSDDVLRILRRIRP